MDKGTKSHFFSNSILNLETTYFDVSELEINLEKTSNDTYLKSEKLKNSIQNNQSLLNSLSNMRFYTDEIDLSIEISSFEDLTKEKNSDKYQFILPSFKFSKIFFNDTDINGNLKYTASGVSQQRNTNMMKSI